MSTYPAISAPAMADPLIEKAFWMRMLHGAIAPPELHVKCRPERPVSDDSISLMLEFDVNALDAARSKNESFITEENCIAAVLIALNQYTGQENILIGLGPKNWHEGAALDNSLLPLRCMVHPGEPIQQLRRDVASLVEKMYQHQAARQLSLRWQPAIPSHADGWPKPNITVLPNWSGAIPEPSEGSANIAFSTIANRTRLGGRFHPRAFDYEGACSFLAAVKQIAGRIPADSTARISEIQARVCKTAEDAREIPSGNAIGFSDRTVQQFTPADVLIAAGELLDPAQLMRAIEERKPLALQISPALMAELLEYSGGLNPRPRQLDALQFVVIASEPVFPSLINEWLSAYPKTQIAQRLRMESDSPEVIITRPVDDENLFVPIPLADSCVQIQRQGKPMPLGVPGEIWIKTASASDNGSMESVPGETSWRSTGEWGKLLRGGTLEWFGRAADQAGEDNIQRVLLEAVLAGHPQIRQCAVITARKAELTKSAPLPIACIASRGGLDSAPASLVEFAASRLGCKIDFEVRYVSRFPLLPDGRTDREALRNTGKQDGTPRHLVDEALIALWCEVLQVPAVGIHDDFFMLGGHSVLAMQLTARIRRIFQIDIPLRKVFEAPSIAAVSDMLLASEKAPGQMERLAGIWQRARTMSPEEIKQLLGKTQV